MKKLTIGLFLLFAIASCNKFSMQKVIVTYTLESVTVKNKNVEPLLGQVLCNDIYSGAKSFSSPFTVGGKSSVTIPRDSLLRVKDGLPIIIHDSLVICFVTQPDPNDLGKTACASPFSYTP